MQSIDRRLGHCFSFLGISQGRTLSLAVLALLAGTTSLHAAPSGGTVTSGSANIAQNGSTTTVTQNTPKASINWNRFSIGTSETVNFVQPSIASITLNRVIGNEKSVIDGALNANGQVWILNSNGVLFNANAKITTSGLLAASKDLSDEDFQNGVYRLKGESTASVVNLGTIEINNGGYASLFANTVQNAGVMKAVKGVVTLTGADEATINLNGNSLVSLKVDKGVLDALVENKGAIIAEGGKIYLTTNAVNELLKGVVNQTGILEADSIDDITGEIILYAHGGTTNVGGTLSALEGFIETSGETLYVSQDVSIKAKEWTLDPTDITVQDGGGTNISGSTVDADTITTVLNGGTNVTLSASGDIRVNEDLVWSGATYLRLTAGDEIYVNAAVQNTNTTYGGVYFSAANTTSKVIFGTDGLVTIYNPYQLQWMSRAVNGKYALGGNINASVTSTWNSGAGFVPVGTNVSPFTGTFDGNGYTIDGLSAHWSGYYFIGLIGYAGSGATIYDVGLTNASVIGSYYVGGLVGYSNHADIHDAYAQGSVSGLSSVGGLVGYNNYGTIDRTYAEGSVLGTGNSIGGLVGKNLGSISDSYATGSVVGQDYVGGLVGYSNYGTLSNVYALGDVSGSNGYTGGLVGILFGNASVTNAYATGNVVGKDYVGGLIGENDGTVSSAYAMGHVSGTSYVGGFAGCNYGSISASYWDIDTSGKSTSISAGSGSSSITGLHSLTSTIDAFTQAAYSNLDFSGKWYMIDGQTRPFLRSEYSTIISNDHQLQLAVMDLSASYTLAKNIVYTAEMWSSAGFVPIGSALHPFSGTFEGDYHTVDALTINRPTEDYVGLFGMTTSSSSIHAIGLTDSDISGRHFIGGLAGYNYAGSISDSYVTGSVSGMDYVGEVAGTNDAGMLTGNYASGSVSGRDFVGGLVGWNYASGVISNSYATGSVNGNTYVGGLVGHNDSSTILNSYALGGVSGNSVVGGLSGSNYLGTISDSYWDIDSTGQTNGISTLSNGTLTHVVGLQSTGASTAFLKSSYGGFDFDTVWIIYEGYTHPLLRSFMTPLSVTVHNASKTYDGLAYSGSNSISYSQTPDSRLHGSVTYAYGGDATNAGTTTIIASGLYSDQQGYLIHYVDGTLTIAKANATVSMNSDTKTYNGLNQSATGYTVSGLVNGEDASVIDSVIFSGGGKDVGTYTLTGSASDNNYNLTVVDGTLTVTPATLTVTAVNASKTSNAIAYGGGAGVTYSGFMNDETPTVLSGSLHYGGTSQGAVDEGEYSIVVSGLSSSNYAITYIDGLLTITSAPNLNIAHIENGTAIRPPLIVSSSPSSNTEDSLTYSSDAEALQGLIHQATIDTTRIPLWTHSLIQLINGGVHLPEGLEQEYFTAQQ